MIKQALKTFFVFVTVYASVQANDLLSQAEKQYNIPDNLLRAIAYVESKISPWMINALGQSKSFKTKEEAAAFIRYLRDKGIGNINIGYMQINYKSHHKRFNSIEDMLDPDKNIAFAAKLLLSLKKKFGSWEAAIKYYHSANSTFNQPYFSRVNIAWSRAQNKEINGKAHSGGGILANLIGKSLKPQSRSKINKLQATNLPESTEILPFGGKNLSIDTSLLPRA